MVLLREHCCHLPSPSLGLRNPPRPLLVASPTSTGSSDSDGGLFAVPTTLPPNSRHGKLFFPNKETELTFRQHLSSISVSGPAPHPRLPGRPSADRAHSAQHCLPADAVGLLPAKAQEAAEPAPAEAAGGPGQHPAHRHASLRAGRSRRPGCSEHARVLLGLRFTM